MTMRRTIAAVVVALWSPGCGLLGPSCLDRQERGSVETINGEVAAGRFAMHQVLYATAGSQNDAEISWADQYAAGGPKIKVYATKAGCVDFAPPPAVQTGSCTILASAGSGELGIDTTLIVTQGRGNTEILG